VTEAQRHQLRVLTAADPMTAVLALDGLSGILYVAHTPREESVGRVPVGGGDPYRPTGYARTFVYRIHPDGRRCGWGWGVCDECARAGDSAMTRPLLVDGAIATPEQRERLQGTIAPQLPRMTGATSSTHRSAPASAITRPEQIVHADWGTAPSKRWAAEATLRGDRYAVSAPALTVDPIAEATRDGTSALVGFDFPIGLPAAYASRVGVESFVDFLPSLGAGDWRDFFVPAATPEEISLGRPFYPRRPGGTSHRHLLDALGFASMNELRRKCELPHDGRGAAEVLFWTLGPKQVGRAAIAGWRDVLIPHLANIRLWPFAGSLDKLLAAGGAAVVCETYPSEFYGHLGLPRAKTAASRAAAASALVSAASELDVELDGAARVEIDRGFVNDDAYDAFVGLLGMINVVSGRRAAAPELPDALVRVEGWILGRP
jgi:hypothetical protein